MDLEYARQLAEILVNVLTSMIDGVPDDGSDIDHHQRMETHRALIRRVRSIPFELQSFPVQSAVSSKRTL